MRYALQAVVLAVMFCVTRSRAGLISFETTPSGETPVDNADLTDPYTYSGGSVRFFFDTNGNNRYDPGVDALPQFELAGGSDPINGFHSEIAGGFDTARTGYQAELGNFFLRQPGGNQVNPPGPFIAAYTSATPIRALSGEIWDIDGNDAGTEQWRVDVLSGTGSVLATELSPLGVDATVTSLDSLPWTFQFQNLPDGVASVRLTFVGSKTDGTGLAFNNFSPDVAVPEPGSAAIMLLLGGLLVRRRRRHLGITGPSSL